MDVIGCWWAERMDGRDEMKNVSLISKAAVGLVIMGAIAIVLMKLWPVGNAETQGNDLEEELMEGIKLPEPRFDGEVGVEKAIKERRSVREYKDERLSLAEVAQLLWAAQGVTGPDGLRAAPSAGALYPLEVYVVVGMVEELDPGVYKYKAEGHRLVEVVKGDKREQLMQAALNQAWIKKAPAIIVLAGVNERTTVKYGERGVKYVQMEAGHVGQNIYLQAVALNLGTAVVGAFGDEQVKELLGMIEEEEPLYLMPVGKR